MKIIKQLKTILINNIMLEGRRETSEILLLKIIKKAQKSYTKNHIDIIKSLLINNTSVIQIKQIKRKKKQLKEFPYISKENARISRAVKSIIILARKDSNTKIHSGFIQNSISVYNQIKKKKQSDIEYAFSFKKFANYRWFD